MWPLFDGWAASHSVDPADLPWDRFLNMVYHFAVRNASKEKKREFDTAISKAISTDQLQSMAMTRKNALRDTETREIEASVPETTPEVNSERRSKLPPRPAGWGDDETATRQAFAVAQSLKVGGKPKP